MSTFSASAIMKAAHQAAKVADAIVAYKIRFSTALKAAWATAKQTINTMMNTVETIYVADPHVIAGGSTSQACTYEIHHLAGTVAFVTVRREAGNRPVRQRIVSTSQVIAGGAKAFERNGQPFYLCTDFADWSAADARDAAAFGFSMADVDQATASLNA